jgi:sulfite exporter TauE/SafE
MRGELATLIVTAASIGFLHTLFGPDHYLPFIVMAKSGKWSLFKTGGITALCGLGHVLGSIVLGLIGIALGLAVTRVETVESFRGNVAAWFLIAFGLVYCIWGVRRAVKGRPHTHRHVHADEAGHAHTHTHIDEHAHVHHEEGARNVTPWVLFIIFVLGPCEPLIPLLMYPAAKSSAFGVALVATVFGTTTILTMLAVVMVASLGMNVLPLGRLERYTHALAGGTIALCGMAIQFLGL